VLLDGDTQAMRGGQGNALLGEEKVVREQDGEGGSELPGQYLFHL
jgi:hypothetical protein